MTENNIQQGTVASTENTGPRPKLIPLICAVAVTALILFMPTPEGLSLEGQRLMALFLGSLV
ncbi:MAG: hypothetical protein WD601_12490, partial [Pseudohongiellaceae bacterium]